MNKTILLALLSVVPVFGLAQVGPSPPVRTDGFRVVSGLPATCVLGQTRQVGATASYCSATNTWTNFAASGSGIGGSGTAGKLTKFTAGTSVGDSLLTEGTNLIEQYNSTNQQTFNIYRTRTDASNYEGFSLAFDGGVGNAVLSFINAGSGSGRDVLIHAGSGNSVKFGDTGLGSLYAVNSTGMIPASDNNRLLGDSGARFSTGYFGTSLLLQGANGQAAGWKYLTELTTIAAAATTDTAIQIPANAIVMAVSVRVTTVIPTAATFTVIGTTSSTAFQTGASVSTAATTTDAGTKSCPYLNTTAQTIRITPNLTPADDSGRVRVTIIYFDSTPPTS
jgi:hypothetical protein